MSERRPTAQRRTAAAGTAQRTHSAQAGNRRPAGTAVRTGNAPRRKLSPEQRRRLEQKRRIRKLKQNLKFIIPAAVLLIIAIILIAVTGGSGKKDSVADTALMQATSAPVSEDTAADTDLAGGTEGADTAELADTAVQETPQPTQAPAAEATYYTGEAFDYASEYIKAVNGEVTGPEIQPKYTNVDPAKQSRWPEVSEGHLPILYKVEGLQEKTICITVDDCYQAENLRSIVQCALDNNGKLTIFPIGSNIAKESIGSVVKWAWENGMELENHTYNHVGLYHYDDKRMEQEIWYQNCELNELLGVNYTEHFFRPHGGDEREDQRDHAYISQLGFYGIAVWSDDGSKSEIETLEKGLAPGKIYLFHTTDNDLNLLSKFIPYAVSQGYTLVTLNEMYGLPDNETSELTTTKSVEPPVLAPFKIVIPTLKKVSYMRAAAVVQERLIELGWLKGDADGEYGTGSYEAVGYFQKAMGIDADGIAGPTTQAALFSSDAKHK